MTGGIFNAPWSGPVEQWINPVTTWFSPTINVTYRGDGPIERRVITEAAGYGRQLDALIGAVLELADGREATGGEARAEGPKVAALRSLAAKIEETKAAARRGEPAPAADDPEDPEAAAVAALERLKAEDPKKLAAVLKRFG